jgi:hypothetical protein
MKNRIMANCKPRAGFQCFIESWSLAFDHAKDNSPLMIAATVTCLSSFKTMRGAI